MGNEMNPKLKAMMDALEIKSNKVEDEADEDNDGVDFSPNALLGKLLAGKIGASHTGNGPSPSDHFAANPASSAPKVAQANAGALTLMPTVANEDWLVNVFPDSSNVIHFQAKSSSVVEGYTKWYVVVDAEKWKAVKTAYDANTGRRKSFWEDSNKQYLIAKRVSDTAVEIPGYGLMEVPQLFS